MKFNLFSQLGSTNSSDRLFFGFIVFIGLVVAYIFYNNHTPPVIADPAPASDLETKMQNLNIDLKLLDRISESGLEVFGDIPGRPASAGKDDLFAPGSGR